MSLTLHTAESLEALAAAAADPVHWSPFGEEPVFCMALDDAAECSARSRHWLAGLCCPVIGIGAPRGPLAAACDVRVDEPQSATELTRRIAERPQAATSFVRLLRATARMELAAALEAESLAYACLQSGPEYQRWLAAYSGRAPVVEAGPAVLLERLDHRLRLRLNRPQNRNAMSVEMRDALNEALQLAQLDVTIEQIEISATGPCFSTGGELSEFGAVPNPVAGHLIRAVSLPGRNLAACAARSSVTVHGACIGSGIEFPAFAGRLRAHADAWFQLPEIGMGLIPGAGGCVSIARRIGRQRLAWLGLSGARIDAQQALHWGLIDEIVTTTPQGD